MHKTARRTSCLRLVFRRRWPLLHLRPFQPRSHRSSRFIRLFSSLNMTAVPPLERLVPRQPPRLLRVGALHLQPLVLEMVEVLRDEDAGDRPDEYPDEEQPENEPVGEPEGGRPGDGGPAGEEDGRSDGPPEGLVPHHVSVHRRGSVSEIATRAGSSIPLPKTSSPGVASGRTFRATLS